MTSRKPQLELRPHPPIHIVTVDVDLHGVVPERACYDALLRVPFFK